MSEAIDIAAPRIMSNAEEGFRLQPYNDANGLTISCRPQGNLTWLYGLNLETAGSRELGEVILRWWLANVIEKPLVRLGWYASLDPARQSVFLDMGYALGVLGLLQGFPNLIKAAAIFDWVRAQQECHVKDPKEDARRYQTFRQILLTGNAV